MPAANPEPFHLPRRRFLLGAGGLAAGALASPYLADPATAAAVEVVTNNPVITNIYTADPDAFVFDGRFYLDVDRDEAPLGVNDFVMREWYIYSSTDLVHWTDHGVRMSLATFAWANRNAWAPQMVHRDGRFYWYVPVQKAATNSMSIGVAVGDSPSAPSPTRSAAPDRQHDGQPQRVRHRPDRAHRRRRTGLPLLGLVLVAPGGRTQAEHDRAGGSRAGGAALGPGPPAGSATRSSSTAPVSTSSSRRCREWTDRLHDRGLGAIRPRPAPGRACSTSGRARRRTCS